MNFEIPAESFSGAGSSEYASCLLDGMLPFGEVDPGTGFRGRLSPPGCIVDEPEAGRKAAVFLPLFGAMDRIREL